MREASAVSDDVASSVVAFYSGRGVLVSGATGLLGKVLVEKLLWAVPDIGTVFMLMRPKRGKAEAERLSAIQELPVRRLVTITTKYKGNCHNF